MYKSIDVSSSKIRSAATTVTVVGVYAGETKLPKGLAGLDADAKKSVTAALKQPGFKAATGESVLASCGCHMLVGLGSKDALNDDALRLVGGRLVRTLERMGMTGATLQIAEVIDQRSIAAHRVGQLLGEGIGLANWRVSQWDGAATKNAADSGKLRIATTEKDCREGLTLGLTLAESTNYARSIAATPPNICNPTFMVKEARRMARSVGLKCKVIDFRKAQELGMGGLVNVGKGSDSKPALIILEHTPKKVSRRARGKTLALVGKTITYDTGGYSIKISGSMRGMKSDKNGGMAVLGAMHAIASLDLPVKVVGLLPAAENMINGESYRPDDIIEMYNGATVEVTNTDAEGRLVLADALAYACKNVKATHIIDTATLTGGVVVGLGHFCSGMWCNDDDLRGRIDDASQLTGEKTWRMPLWEDHRDFMRAKHADLWNSAPSRNAHPIQGAAFLSFFVESDVPWAHIDIAGVSDVDSDKPLYVSGPTGYGVRLLTEVAQSFA